jgi:uncharacterized protein involved in exopolysaccharide biosynthesis
MVDLNREIDSVERALELARQKYTENNPDVRDLVTRLGVLREDKEELSAKEAAERDEKASQVPKVSLNTKRDIQEFNARIELLKTQIDQKNTEISDYSKQVQQISGRIGIYEKNVNTIPIGEQEYATLVRDEALARDKYQLRLEALNKAQIAAEMEGRSQGESLQLLDSASLPNSVEEPNRPVVISIGAVAGLLLGVVIAGAREMKDTSLKNLKDVRAYTQMAILGSVPLLENDFVVRRRRRLAWLAWTVACLFSGLTMAGAVVYYYLSLPTVG